MKKQQTDITMSATEQKIEDLKRLLAEAEEKLKEEKAQERFSWFNGTVYDMIQVIEEFEEGRDDPAFEKSSKWADVHYNEGDSISFGDGWTIKNIHVEGGGEGDGETHFAILELTRHGNNCGYFKIPGWYASYDGGTLELSELHEVRPVERLVTFWE